MIHIVPMISVMDNVECKNVSQIRNLLADQDGIELEILVVWVNKETNSMMGFSFTPLCGINFEMSLEEKFQYVLKFRQLVLQMRRNVQWEKVNMYIAEGMYDVNFLLAFYMKNALIITIS